MKASQNFSKQGDALNFANEANAQRSADLCAVKRELLTDVEIIKALECCKEKNCNTCPCFDEDIECGEMLIGHTIDLINRKRVESNKYRNKAQLQKRELARLNNQVVKQKAEIERLEHQIDTLCMTLKYAKSEAIKGFAKELKTRIKNAVFCCYDVRFKNHLQELLKIIVAKIDNLVKEMMKGGEG